MDTITVTQVRDNRLLGSKGKPLLWNNAQEEFFEHSGLF